VPHPVGGLEDDGEGVGAGSAAHGGSIASLPAAGSTSRFTKFARLSKGNLFETNATLNRVKPLAWLTDMLERMVSGRTKAHELEQLLPWTWKAEQLTAGGDR
jgi:hypothetical protein